MGCEGMLTVGEAVTLGLIMAAVCGAMVAALAYVHGRQAGRRAGDRELDGLLAKGALQWAPPKPGEPYLVLVTPARDAPSGTPRARG